jgi:hypothetical protein
MRGIPSRLRGRWFDRRIAFRDLSGVPAQHRRARTNLVHIYSAANNIGNYLPVLGIWDLMGDEYDTWNAHDSAIDFDFINQNYGGVIIGGAGLLHRAFEGFWRRFITQCEIPAVTWGVGTCIKDSERELRTDDRSVSMSVGREALSKCVLVSLRDPMTVDWYGIGPAHIAACPTIHYLASHQSRQRTRRGAQGDRVLFSSHPSLVGESETDRIVERARTIWPDLSVTNNMQRRRAGLHDIIEQYRSSSLVVSTRLHGAIIAFGLDLPYIAIARDDKIRSFATYYGGGVVLESDDDLRGAVEDARSAERRASSLSEVREFADTARAWASSLG